MALDPLLMERRVERLVGSRFSILASVMVFLYKNVVLKPSKKKKNARFEE